MPVRLPAPPLPAWLDAMLPFERALVDVGEHRMHVLSAGEGPTVVLLHGNPTWSFLWRRVAAALLHGESGSALRLVMPDLVGLGLSGKPRNAREHTLERHATWLGRLLDVVAPQRLLFVGHDWGGPIGLRALAERSDRVAGIVLTNTVAGPPREGARPAAFHRFANLPLVSTLAFRCLGFPQRALHRAQGDRRSIHGAVARAYRWPLRGLRRNVAPLALARMVPVGREHPSLAPLRRVQEWVESWRGPAAIVWGERDPVIGRALGRLSRQLPQAPVVRTSGGHFLQEETPAEIARAIADVARQAFG